MFSFGPLYVVVLPLVAPGHSSLISPRDILYQNLSSLTLPLGETDRRSKAYHHKELWSNTRTQSCPTRYLDHTYSSCHHCVSPPPVLTAIVSSCNTLS